ncbi:hypothetical protein C8Q74DRAFT_1203315 [Fomes fomentarius]|nr:hypothetical protein C8Q74DRAFT_1203315 [Fomes fomentarius]
MFGFNINALALILPPNDTVTIDVVCSATVFLFWDMLLNIDSEVQYIWWGAGGWVKWLYLFLRHMPYLAIFSVLATAFLAPPSDPMHAEKCRAWVAYEGILVASLILTVDIVLIARVYAMFSRSRFLLAILGTLFIAYIVGACTVLALSIPQMKFTSGCVVIYAPETFSLIWIMGLAFETTLFAFTLIKSFLWLLTQGRLRRQSIMTILIRDGMLTVTTIMYRTQNNSLASVSYPRDYVLAVMSFAGSHVLLNLRKFAIDLQDSMLSGVDTLPGDASGRLSSAVEFGETGDDPAREDSRL